MRVTNCLIGAALLLAASALPAQETQVASADTGTPAAATTRDTTAKAAAAKPALVQTIGIQNLRPNDQRGVNMFETPKKDAVPFTGFRTEFGAAFTQQFQGLDHSNTAVSMTPTGGTANANQLMRIGHGFNNAVANAYLNAQLARGIRVAMTAYLSSRHHNETWVKDGYLLIDASPIEFAPLDKLMEYVTVKAGHFEINYGDTHFRRTDNGNSMYNPFVGNTLLDAFTTEVGGEVYFRNSLGMLAMVGGTGGESRGMTTRPQDRSIAIYSKIGFDRQLTGDLRVRLTGSTFNQPSSTNNTLFAGDRAGSRYYNVVENTAATESGAFKSGLVDPGFGDKIRSYSVNPFVQVRGVELFADLTNAKGRKAIETEYRDAKQQSYDLVYRFLRNDRLFVGTRYNTVEATMNLTRPASDLGPLMTANFETTVTRNALAAGWYITPTIVLKGEYVQQKYEGFPEWDIRRGAKFEGFVIEGGVAF